ncbi:MAG: phosphatidylserine decarboxylase family protein [Bacteroidaceae bacterium]|nr:phosphatidylserine decarboxylase family protein [Bacteroidaceae bacterium]
MTKTKKFKKIRLHQEGTATMLWGGLVLAAINGALFLFTMGTSWVWLAYCTLAVCLALYAAVVNFFRCPIRVFEDETEGVVVAPADGRIVVCEEVQEEEYFHDRRLMISVFMSPLNVHANWFPVGGKVLAVKHVSGNFHKAWLPKASTENEHADTLIEVAGGERVLVRQVAGALARRIVTYPREGDTCYIDEHLGFIKFGSRVDVYLPLTATPRVKVEDKTVGNQTVIAQL